MSTPASDSEKAPHDIPAAPAAVPRLWISTNVVIQGLLLLFILGLLNAAAFHYYKRFDFSRDNKFSLSEQSRLVMAGLKEPLSVFVIVPAEGFPLYDEVETLLREYEYAGRPNVKIEFVDTYKDITRTTDLQSEYQFDKSESVIVVAYGGRSKVIPADTLYTLDAAPALAMEQPRVTEFLGEQKLTSAILEVTEDRQPKVLYTEGHKEPGFIAEPPLGLFTAYLERDNMALEPVNLATVAAVPDEVSMIAIIDPKFDFSEREIGLLGQYWDRGGRIFAALAPETKTPRLDAFFEARGLKLRGDRVLRTLPMGAVTAIIKDPTGVFQQGSPITDKLVGANTQFFGGTQSLGIDDAQAGAAGYTIKPLIETPEGFWGETLHTDMERDGVYFDLTDDFEGPLTLAASVEKAGVSDPRVAIGGPRLVLVGNGRLFDEESTNEPNVFFGLAAFNWLLDREALIGVPPKAMRNFSLKLTAEQQSTILFVAIFAIPGLALSAGVLAWWIRRS